MDDLISRQAAVELCMKYNGVGWVWSQILDGLKEMPSAVVCCKDCKHYYYADNRIPSERGWVCANDGCYVSQNDYCSWGERKDE